MEFGIITSAAPNETALKLRRVDITHYDKSRYTRWDEKAERPMKTEKERRNRYEPAKTVTARPATRQVWNRVVDEQPGSPVCERLVDALRLFS
jgi:hypothetical protein